MDECPLVKLAQHHQILKQFEGAGQVAIPTAEWIRSFEALTYVSRDGAHREIFCEIEEDRLIFSRVPFKKS